MFIAQKKRQTQLTASLLGEWGFFRREGQQKTLELVMRLKERKKCEIQELPLFSQVNIKRHMSNNDNNFISITYFI